MATYYVDSSRPDDTGDGQSEATAKKSLGTAVGLLGPGDKLYVKSGTYTLTSQVVITSTQCGSSRNNPTVIEGYVSTPGDRPRVGGSRPLITCSAGGTNLFVYSSGSAAGYLELRSLKFSHTASGTRGSAILGVTGTGSVAGEVRIWDVEAVGCATGFNGGARLFISEAHRLTVRNSTGDGIGNLQAFTTDCVINDCKFIDNAGHGVNFGANIVVSPLVVRTVFSGNGGAGCYQDYQVRLNAYRFGSCTWEGNLLSGLKLTATSGVSSLRVWDSVFDAHPSGYGIELTGPVPMSFANVSNSAFRANASGASVGLTSELDSVFPSTDPFVSAAAENWAPNNTGGAGALLRASAAGGGDLGAIQHPDTGGTYRAVILGG